MSSDSAIEFESGERMDLGRRGQLFAVTTVLLGYSVLVAFVAAPG